MKSKLVKEVLNENDFQLFNPETILNKSFKKLGVDYDEETGIISCTSHIGKMACKMAVKDGYFEQMGENKFRLIGDEECCESIKEEMTPADRGFEAARKEGSKKLSEDERDILYMFLQYLYEQDYMNYTSTLRRDSIVIQFEKWL